MSRLSLSWSITYNASTEDFTVNWSSGSFSFGKNYTVRLLKGSDYFDIGNNIEGFITLDWNKNTNLLPISREDCVSKIANLIQFLAVTELHTNGITAANDSLDPHEVGDIGVNANLYPYPDDINASLGQPARRWEMVATEYLVASYLSNNSHDIVLQSTLTPQPFLNLNLGTFILPFAEIHGEGMYTNTLHTESISEKTINSGVTIDGVLLKDNLVYQSTDYDFRVIQNETRTIKNNVNTPLKFNAVQYGGEHYTIDSSITWTANSGNDPFTGQPWEIGYYTATPKAVYEINAYVRWQANSNGNRILFLYRMPASTGILEILNASTDRAVQDNTMWQSVNYSGILESGDKIFAVVYHNATSGSNAVDIEIQAISSPLFSVTLVKAVE